jgi:hypothetical protein
MNQLPGGLAGLPCPEHCGNAPKWHLRMTRITRPDGSVSYYPQAQKPGEIYWEHLESETVGLDTEKHAIRRFKNVFKKQHGIILDEPIDYKYFDIVHKTVPDSWINKFCPGGRGMFIGGGKSGYYVTDTTTEWIDNNIDIAIVANGAWIPFVKFATECRHTRWVWMSVERSTSANGDTKCEWANNIPSCFQRVWLAGEDQLASLVWAGSEVGTISENIITQCHHNDPFNPREYGEGLQTGKEDEGTVCLQAMHLLAIAGCNEIAMWGCELDWEEGKPCHFYDVQNTDQHPTQRKRWDKAAMYIAEVLPEFKKAGCNIAFAGDTRIMKYV